MMLLGFSAPRFTSLSGTTADTQATTNLRFFSIPMLWVQGTRWFIFCNCQRTHLSSPSRTELEGHSIFSCTRRSGSAWRCAMTSRHPTLEDLRSVRIYSAHQTATSTSLMAQTRLRPITLGSTRARRSWRCSFTRRAGSSVVTPPTAGARP